MRFQHLHRDERGMSLVAVGFGFMGLLAATTLSVDVGTLMTARSQAQNSADAGALAGAVALSYNDYANRASSGPAVQSSVNAARANLIVGEAPSVDPGDVAFLPDTTGQPNRVQVTVYRSGSRNNAVRMVMGGFFGIPTANITATATAEATPANAATCVAPFAIADKWIEKQTGGWDPNDSFNAFPGGSQTGDIYRAATSTTGTGYNATTDRGVKLVLKPAAPGAPGAGSYWATEGSGSTAADYIADIANCNPDVKDFGETLNALGGNMTAAMKQGMDDLIAKDPSAYWDTAANKVVSSMNPSPRIKVVPVYDPLYWNQGKQAGHAADLKAANYIGFFIESVAANGDVTGRITPAPGVIDSSSGPSPVGAFGRVVRLVQ